MISTMWERFLRAFAISGVAALMLALALILLVDPLGVSPIAVIEPKPGYALKDRRFLAQQLIRNGQFDSFLVGSSTIRSIRTGPRARWRSVRQSRHSWRNPA